MGDAEVDALLSGLGVGRGDRGLWELIAQGETIVPRLQRIRRHGPGRLRAAALRVLVAIAGEAGLHPDDLAAAERLVRLKIPRENPLRLALCWDAWMCVRGGDQRGIMATLGLTPARPATFALAASVVTDERTDEAYGLVFVTPELNGWTLVAGRWCDPGDEERAEQVRARVERLSAVYGAAHAFFTTEFSDCSAWLIAENGRTVRRFSEHLPALALGRPLPIEHRILDELGLSGNPDDLEDHDRHEFSWFCGARTVSAEMSVEISAGIRREDGVVRGTGLLAWVPGSPVGAIAPGRYEI